MSEQLRLRVLSTRFGICQLAADAGLPAWVAGNLTAVVRTPDELSIVCPQNSIPETVPRTECWRCLRVVGPLDFSLVGIIAGLTSILAEAGISVFVISSFNTDFLLVQEDALQSTVNCLQEADHLIEWCGDW